tara:strand:- start:1680 stop:2402 length:723 start_codon:yes stop_codon:yes gene_type:complete
MGASTGIGKALATHYADQDTILGLAARRVDLLEDVARECRNDNAKTYVFKVDVNDEENCSIAANEFIGITGGIDIVIANSGMGSNDDLLSGSSERINKILSTNILGVTNTIIPFLPTMKNQNSGTIVGISSVASFIPLPNRGGYSSSKVAVRRLFDSWRPTLKEYGIKVVTICPGFIDTPMTERIKFKPFLKDADNAAIAFAKAIEKGEKTYVYPWQMRWLVRLVKLIPQGIIDWFQVLR